MSLNCKLWLQIAVLLTTLLMSKSTSLGKTKGLKNKHDGAAKNDHNLTEKKRIKWYIDYDNRRPPECKDFDGMAEVCLSWKDSGLCRDEYDKRIMQQYCPQTCSLCKAPAPIPCMSSDFGCCWDWKTKAESPHGRACPKCKDNYKHLCRQFKSYCDKKGRNGKFVRYKCPKTCGFCSHDQLVISVLEYKF